MLANGTARATARLLVAVILVPLLIMTSGTVSPAQAATVGSAKGWQVALSDFNGRHECKGSARWITGSGTYIEYNGKCWENWSFGGLQPNDFDSGSSVGLEFSGTSLATGTACGVSGSNALSGPGSGVVFSGATTMTSAGDCSIARLCVTLRHVHNNSWDSTATRCVSYSLGAPSSPVSRTCDYASVVLEPDVEGAAVDWRQTSGSNTGYGMRQYVRFDLTGAGVGSGWRLYTIAAYPPQSVMEHQYLTPTHQKNGQTQTATIAAGQAFVGWHSASVTSLGAVQSGAGTSTDVPVVGYGLYRDNPGVSSAGQNSLPQANPTVGLLGVNDPSRCAFYWGPKIADVPNSTIDEPLTPTQLEPGPSELEPPPETEEPSSSCDFSFTDPSTWASAGICALVGLIGRLLSLVGELIGAVWAAVEAILSLVSDLLQGLVQVLTDLFVPDEGFFDQDLADLKEQWSETAPGVYAEALADAIPPLPASSCQGVPVNIDMPMDSGHVNFRFGAACAGDALHTPANIARAAITAALLLGTAVACFRIVTSAIWPGVQVVGNKAGAA